MLFFYVYHPSFVLYSKMNIIQVSKTFPWLCIHRTKLPKYKGISFAPSVILSILPKTNLYLRQSQKIAKVILLILLSAIFFLTDFDSTLFEFTKNSLSVIRSFYQDQPALFTSLFFILFTAVNALMIPGSLILLLLAF